MCLCKRIFLLPCAAGNERGEFQPHHHQTVKKKKEAKKLHRAVKLDDNSNYQSLWINLITLHVVFWYSVQIKMLINASEALIKLNQVLRIYFLPMLFGGILCTGNLSIFGASILALFLILWHGKDTYIHICIVTGTIKLNPLQSRPSLHESHNPSKTCSTSNTIVFVCKTAWSTLHNTWKVSNSNVRLCKWNFGHDHRLYTVNVNNM